MAVLYCLIYQNKTKSGSKKKKDVPGIIMVEELEPHLREKILYYLDEKSLSQARLVNKSWYEASNRKVFLQQCIHKVQTYFEEDTGWPVLMSKIIIPDLRILANFMVQNYKMNKDYPRTVFNTAAFVGNQDIIDLLSKYYQDKNPPNEKGTNYIHPFCFISNGS
jgi:hypothetical protein